MKKSHSRILWTVIVLIVVFGIAYWLGSRQPRTPQAETTAQPAQSPVTATEQAKTEEDTVTKTASPAPDAMLQYTNDDYKFVMKLPARWQGFRVSKDSDEWGDHYSFELKKATGGYGSIFTLSAYSKNAWDKVMREAIKPVFLAGRGDTVFAYSLGQDDAGFAGFPDVEAGLRYKGPLFDAQETIIPSFELK